MNTIRIEKLNTRMIAHRGVSGIERENTAAAFVAAGNRSYFGIETDVHRTFDGKYILIHDDDTQRVTGTKLPVEGGTFEELRALHLPDLDGTPRGDLILPTPEEYFSICKKYEKTSVFELKNRFEREQIREIVEIVKESGWLEHTIFISFSYDNMRNLRSILSDQPAQYLFYGEIDETLIERLTDQRLGLDVRHDRLNERTVSLLREHDIEINCWTVNDPLRGEELVRLGVDYITTNILE